MPSAFESARPTPKAFISYAWDNEAHKIWVRDFAIRLRKDGVEVTLDQWHLHPGDQLPAFMERAIHDNDFVLIICTPFYADRSNRRIGGVGYEGDIMTGEVFTTRNERKFIPIYRVGADWQSAAPTWLKARYRIDLRGEPYAEDHYQDLFHTLHGTRPVPPPVIPRSVKPSPPTPMAHPETFTWDPIRILGVSVDEVTTPRSDGTRGSALYRIPFQLSRSPTRLWRDFFIEAWDHPSSYTLTHRPGIARIEGDKLVLNGTTIEEVEHTHRKTLMLALGIANRKLEEVEAQMSDQEQQKHRDRARYHGE